MKIKATKWYSFFTDDNAGVGEEFNTKREALYAFDSKSHREGKGWYRMGSHSYIVKGKQLLLEGVIQ